MVSLFFILYFHSFFCFNYYFKSAENLSFYVDVKNLEKVDDSEVDETAKGIISKYIATDSPFEINIDHKTRTKVLESEHSRTMFVGAIVCTVNYCFLLAI